MASTRRYPCVDRYLYVIARLGWTAYANILALFTALSASYTALLGTNWLAAIDAAEALPDFQARNVVTDTLRIALQAENETVLSKFKALKTYIKRAFPAINWESNFDAAGQGYYELATGESWAATEAMLASMVAYITANSVALLAGSIMSVAFQASVTTLQGTFGTAYLDYQTGLAQNQLDADAKVDANNDINDALIAMFQDSLVLVLTATQRKQFNFSYLLGFVSNAGASGIAGTVTDALGAPIAGALVEEITLGRSTLTNADGSYSLGLPSGTFTIDVIGPTGIVVYLPFSGPVTVDTGVVEAFNVTLLT